MKHPHADLMIAYAQNMNMEIEEFDPDMESWSIVYNPDWNPAKKFREHVIQEWRWAFEYQSGAGITGDWYASEEEMKADYPKDYRWAWVVKLEPTVRKKVTSYKEEFVEVTAN